MCPTSRHYHIPSEFNFDFYRTGVHSVQDVFCMGCNDRIGWYYMKASDPSQKYKEGTSAMLGSKRFFEWLIPPPTNAGKYLLEREKLVKDNAWTLDQ